MISLSKTISIINLNKTPLSKCFVQLFPRTIATETKELVNVSVNDKSGVAVVTLQRPPVNSLNLELIKTLNQTLIDLTKGKCRGMILSSASPTVFSAGLDILEMYKPNMDRAREFWSSLQDLWLNLNSAIYPTAAAIAGHAPAGGCLLSMSCEYRVMAPNFTIGLNETKLGLVAPTWFKDSMLNTIGPRQTEFALTSGRLFSTEEALKVGLIDEVGANKEEIIQKCETFIKKFKNISPAVRATSKLVIRQSMIDDLRKTRDQDLNNFMAHIANPQTQKLLEMYLQSLKK